MPHTLPGILVTATSSNHFQQAHGLIRTAQKFLPPAWRFQIYDLVGDLSQHEVRKLSSWCGTEYRRFDSRRANATWERKYLTLSVWKPFVISDCLKELPENGVCMYADTSTRLHAPLSAELLSAVQTIGVVGRKTASPIAFYTHQDMVTEIATLMQSASGTNTIPIPRRSLHEYMDAPMVCGCLNIWANTPFVLEQLLAPWLSCVTSRACILPVGADGQDNRIGLSSKCSPGLGGHCHRGDQSALSVILYEAFKVRARGEAPYLRNTSAGAETWKMCQADLYGTRFTTERSSWQSPSPMLQDHASCTRATSQPDKMRSAGVTSATNAEQQQPPRRHGRIGQAPQMEKHPSTAYTSPASCSGLTLTRVAVPTGIQPIFPSMGGPRVSLKRLLRPCATENACSVGADGCLATGPQASAIGRCNATHGVEYEHRLPLDGEPAIVSFFNPSASNVREALAAVAKARPRLYFEFEPPVHARVPQPQVLLGVDGQMTYARRAMVHYPYFTPTQLWSAARQPAESRGFHERLPAVAVFVSNCRGHRAEAIDWLRRRFDVHSYGACKHGGNTSDVGSGRRQRIEGGHFPECLRYRAVLAIENNACEDYVSEKLLEAVRCGAVPIVRTFKGLPNYKSLYGPLPLLDAENLDDKFETLLRSVLTQRRVWESYLPSHSPGLAPPPAQIAALDSPNPHCQLIDAAARFQRGGDPIAASAQEPLKQIRCETWYRLTTPHGIQQLPRAPKQLPRAAAPVNSNASGR